MMRRVPGFVPFTVCFLLACPLLCCAPSAAQQAPPSLPPGMGTGPVSTSVNGTVTDAATHAQIDKAQVELRAVTGGTIGIVFTSGSGNFQLENIESGTYNLVVDKVGYQIVTLPVEVLRSPVYGIQVELQRTADADTAANKAPDAVSARELSIPRKAHDDMEKGMALLYGKSDYQGSLRPLEKAAQEYPDYYEAYTQIGVAYMKLADAGNAEKSFRKSIEVSQEHYAGAYVGLAELFLSERRFADAEPPARKAVEIDPDSWQARSELARALLELHRFSDAETSAAAAVKLKPDDADLYLILANVHGQLRNAPSLLDDLNHYLALAPTGPFAKQARIERDKVQQALAASKPSPATATTPQP
jgi:Flp pilus assembly protein TadD